ncbi:porin [Duganella sp. FT109W]|uniref:Porin n=1 Tax=Duganella margarita TaxID=2692170 RepID=A0A7X4GYA6_9BURK|nr:porin [Duganella margarita]MYM70799.1 porin [Duganella margarita]MYN38418.1 porin [Duganella margarita]
MKKQLLVAAVLAATAAMQAHAGAMDDGNLSISGFGTVGVAKSNTDDVKFARYNQADGVGDSTRIGLDTNLGLQATYKINDWLSGTAQVLTRKATEHSFTTDLTWAFLKARINDEVSVRVGRVVVPTFLISDYQNVGYANTMMRPPIEMYSQNPIENSDGADINYQHAFGELNFTAQAFAGVSRGKLFVSSGAGSTATYRAPAAGLSVSGEYGPFLLRFAHARADMHINDLQPINGLTTTLNTVGFKQLASDLTFTTGKKIAFTSIGGTMDWNNIVAQAEYAQRRAKEAVYLPDTNSWYTMVGYRIGKVLPYYAHASAKGAGSSVTTPAALARVPALNTAVTGLLASAEQTSDIVGVRWDFAKSVALKVQVDRVKPKAKSGLLINVPAAGYNKDVTVVAAGLDFVF